MKIPKDLIDRNHFIDEVIHCCDATVQDRLTTNSVLRDCVLFGSSLDPYEVKYNKIYPTIDLLSSFLYGQESVQFSINFGTKVPKEQFIYQEKMREKMHEIWTASTADELFAQSLFWSLVYNSMFIKAYWSTGLRTRLCKPFFIGVYREDLSDMDEQEAISHTYAITATQLKQMLGASHPKVDEIIARASPTGVDGEGVGPPKPVHQIILSQSQPNMIGSATMLPYANAYDPYVAADMIEMRELWVWDDDEDQYRVFTIANPNMVVYDRKGEEMFLKGEQPFIKVTPFPLPDYWLGESLVQGLLELQRWREDHLTRVNNVVKRQLRPSRGFSGPWAGLSDEKMVALDHEGGWISTPLPGAKIDNYAPQVELGIMLQYLHEIDQMFNERAGLANILRAQGDEGVRSMEHAQVLARMASARIKKRALIIEDSIERLATTMMRLQREHDKDQYLDDEGKEFLLSQVTDDFAVKVSGHSSSPVFVEDLKLQADKMLKNGIIDGNTWLDLTDPPMVEMLKERNKKIEAAKTSAAKFNAGLNLVKAAAKLK